MQPQYLIKYKGYPDTENTWEPLDNLSCSKLIRQFEHRSTKRRSSIRAIPPVQTYFEYESIMDKRIINGIVSNNRLLCIGMSQSMTKWFRQIARFCMCLQFASLWYLRARTTSMAICSNYIYRFRWNIWSNGSKAKRLAGFPNKTLFRRLHLKNTNANSWKRLLRSLLQYEFSLCIPHSSKLSVSF